MNWPSFIFALYAFEIDSPNLLFTNFGIFLHNPLQSLPFVIFFNSCSGHRAKSAKIKRGEIVHVYIILRRRIDRILFIASVEGME